MMNYVTTSAVKNFAHNTYVAVFDDVLDLEPQTERLAESYKWLMETLVEIEGFNAGKAAIIVTKIQKTAIRKAVNWIHKHTYGAFDGRLEIWRGY